ncbi:MAG: AAA family ATPase [Candidatus Micrarchaeaceae archaeon]
MLHLEKLTLHNFKSFRQASIKFIPGFNCIVGPNGSGKSSICDSLLFVLGETSLKRMRVTNVSQLINNNVKPDPEDGIKRAWVSATLSGSENIEITRRVKSNGKVGYRLNGKRVTRQEVIDVLHAHRSEIETTNTITQGEITRILNLNPKERRELIDVAAGIKEFDEKKETSLKELEKVETKINEAKIMINERKGFLKELEGEKRDAERYFEITGTLKRSRYTILKLREKQLTEEHEKLLNSRATLEKKIAEIAKSLESNLNEVNGISAEKQKLSEELNKRSTEVNSVNHRVEELTKQIAVIKEQIKATEESIVRTEEQADTRKKEKGDLESKLAANASSIKSKSDRLKQLEGELGESEVYALSEEDNAQMVNKYESDRTELERLEKDSAALELERGVLSNSMHTTEEKIAETEEALKSELDAYAKAEALIESNSKERKELEKRYLDMKEGLKIALDEEAKLKEEVGKADLEIFKIKEKLSIYGGPDKIGRMLEKAMAKGFYGRVKDLIEYDSKYVEAVWAAAQSRLNYFIVESISDAERAIQILKEEGLERSSFIPMNEVIVREQRSEKELKPLLDFIRYDKKFDRAMRFVFSNTFIIESVARAKELGIGKARFVTLDGELVEASGVVSGGGSKAAHSAIALSSRLTELQNSKAALEKKVEEVDYTMESQRKELAEAEVRIMTLDSDSKRMKAELLNSKARIGELRSKKEEYEKALASNKERLEKIGESIAAFSRNIQKLKEESGALYSAISEMLSTKGRSIASKEKRAKISAVRNEAEQLRVELASLSKENEMMQQRVEAISAELSGYASQIKDSKERKKALEEEMDRFEKSKEELGIQIKEHDSKSAVLFKSASELDEKLSKLSFEKGRLESELAKARTEVQAQEMQIAQAQTRLADIKAELLSYQGVIPIEGLSLKELEEKEVLLKADLEALGSVNLKAPEMYEERRKMLEEAEQKLSTLESEKASILSIINEVESKKLNVFNETLEKVNQNFSKLYPYIFEGEAQLHLSDPKNPFESGLVVSISKTKRASSVETMSGGEKSLITIMLILSIQMMNPMSLYIFDEIDSALDEENSKKLSKLIKELSRKSQFIVVSHNTALIQAADVAVGVTRQEGESRVVGIRFTDQRNIAAYEGGSANAVPAQA